MSYLNCVIIDDEPLASKLVATFVNQTPFLKLQGIADSAIDALQVIQELQPDLIYLDINMPNLSGMELAKVLVNQNSKIPKIIFTTAYSNYAIEGYKVNAVDYLLKPFSYQEFLTASSKALPVSEEIKSENRFEINASEFIFLKVEYQWVRVNLVDVLYFESLKDYVKVHMIDPQQSLLSLTSLKALNEKLPEDTFLRISRSYIINLNKISAISKNSIHIGKIEINVGEQYKEAFKSVTDKWIQ